MRWTNLENVLLDIANEYEKGVKENMPSFWDLYKKFKWDMKVGDGYYEIYFEAPTYWYYAENGRGPGKMPPINVIADWIRKRNITPYASKNGRVPTTNQLAFLIARKIGNEGTISEDKGWFKKTNDEIQKTLYDRIGDAIALDVSLQIDEFFKEPF